MTSRSIPVVEPSREPNPPASVDAPRDLPWLFLDLDGTLIPPGEEISRRNVEAIRAYTRAGGRVSVATGRHPLAIRPLVRLLELDTPHLTGNGSVVSEKGDCRLLFGIAERAGDATRELLARKIPHIHYTVGGLYLQSPEVRESHVDLLVTIFHDYRPHRGAPRDPEGMFKILSFVEAEEESRDRGVRDLAAAVGLKAVRTSEHFLELVSPDCSKGAGLALLAEEAGWPIDRTVAVGDSENDLSMLRRAGRGVAVANAVAEVLEAAKQVVPSCADDGVAHLIDRLLDHRVR